VLGQDKQALASYAAMLELAARLTNPLVRPDLRPLAAGKPAVERAYAFLPPSAAHETNLIKKLYGDRPIPDGFNLADELIRRVREGKLSLEPRPESGWYDHQTFALEPLIVPERMPEARRLELTAAYRKELEGLFKALLALTRETHIKQLEVPAAGAGMPELVLSPQLSVEPLATYYLRRARAYRFVRGVLEQAFGKQALGQMRRQSPGGPTNLSLDEELRVMQGLFHGAYLATCDELGLAPEVRAGASGDDRALLRAWASARASDPDLAADLRAMVPLFYDIKRRKMKVWVVLGVTQKKLRASFAKRPVVKAVFDAGGKKVEANVSWDHSTYLLSYFVTAERYVSKLLDRTEFRAHCDRYKTTKAILDHLE